MCKSDSCACTTNSRAAVHDRSLIVIRSMEHVRKYLKHPHEGDKRIVAWDTVVRPPRIVQLTYLTICDTQVAVRQLVLTQEQMLSKLDWVTRRLHLNVYAFHALLEVLFLVGVDWRPELMALRPSLLNRVARSDYQSDILLSNHPPQVLEAFFQRSLTSYDFAIINITTWSIHEISVNVAI